MKDGVASIVWDNPAVVYREGIYECPDTSHMHCNYCHGSFTLNEGGFRNFGVHVRDKHPEIWAADADLRQEAAEYGVLGE